MPSPSALDIIIELSVPQQLLLVFHLLESSQAPPKHANPIVPGLRPQDYASDGPSAQDWATLAAADLAFLCPSGGCQAVNSSVGCAIATVPSRAVMVRPDWAAASAASASLVAAARAINTRGRIFNQTANPS
jgi:hypothetical protein